MGGWVGGGALVGMVEGALGALGGAVDDWVEGFVVEEVPSSSCNLTASWSSSTSSEESSPEWYLPGHLRKELCSLSFKGQCEEIISL